MRTFIRYLLVFLTTLATCVSAQSKPTANELFLIRQNARYGYMDQKGKVVIQPQFSDAHRFSDGLALVRIGNKWGFIDADGKIKIPAEFDAAVEPIHLVQGFRQAEMDLRLAVSRPNLNYGIPHTEQEKEMANQPPGILGGAPGLDSDESSQNQTERKEGRLDLVGDFYEGMARVADRVRSATGLAQKYGFIDKSGQLAIPLDFDGAGYFSQGLAPVSKDGKWGYINQTGKFVIPPQFDYAKEFSQGFAPIYLNRKWGGINLKGELVFSARFNWLGPFVKGVSYASDHLGWGLLKPDGQFLFQHKTGGIQGQKLPAFSANRIPVCDCTSGTNSFGYLDGAGKLIIPYQFQSAGSFTEGLAPVVVKGKCGYINPNGDLVVPATFEAAGEFHNGLAVVRTLDGYGYIDRQGKFVWQPSK